MKMNLICSVCHGKGEINGEVCLLCNGNGYTFDKYKEEDKARVRDYYHLNLIREQYFTRNYAVSLGRKRSKREVRFSLVEMCNSLSTVWGKELLVAWYRDWNRQFRKVN